MDIENVIYKLFRFLMNPPENPIFSKNIILIRFIQRFKRFFEIETCDRLRTKAKFVLHYGLKLLFQDIDSVL